MSSFSLEFKCDGAAFVDDPQREVARILRLVAQKVIAGETEQAVHDVNGNNVGEWNLEIDEENEPVTAREIERQLDRDEIVERLEGTYSIQCRDNDSKSELAEALADAMNTEGDTL
jgi:hypothetical protein